MLVDMTRGNSAGWLISIEFCENLCVPLYDKHPTAVSAVNSGTMGIKYYRSFPTDGPPFCEIQIWVKLLLTF